MLSHLLSGLVCNMHIVSALVISDITRDCVHGVLNAQPEICINIQKQSNLLTPCDNQVEKKTLDDRWSVGWSAVARNSLRLFWHELVGTFSDLFKKNFTKYWSYERLVEKWSFPRGHWGQLLLTIVTNCESAVTAAYLFHLYHSSASGWEDQSCQNQTRVFKNWDRTKLPKHGENAQLCHQK